MSTSIKEKFDSVKLEQLKRNCGKGYAKKIKKDLKETTGKDYTLNYIYRGLSVNQASDQIIESAMRVASERIKGLEEYESVQRR